MSELISGAISGAITDPYSDEAERHAELYYEEIRHNHADVDRIARNTGFSSEQILIIKNYLFLDEHKINGEYQRFDPCFEIAASWQRLAFSPQNIKPHDLTLLNHEIMEMGLIQQGYSQSEAHKITSQTYNYRKESEEYYRNLGYQQGNNKGKNSGGISRRSSKEWEERY